MISAYFKHPLLITRWLYGHTGCQLYAAAGFFFGIGVIISLGLIILEGFLIIYGKYMRRWMQFAFYSTIHFSGIAPFPRSKLHSLMMIGISWVFTLLFVIPPYMDLFGMLRMFSVIRHDIIKIFQVTN